MRKDDPGTDNNSASLNACLKEKRILICVGSGGVGKTTTSAVLAIQGALLGRKSIVCTVDPARRLANSLGVASLEDEAKFIDPERFRSVGLEPLAPMSAMMLDMKNAFDRMVARYTDDLEQRKKILNNRFYNYFSSSLAGAQEYSAMERLHELYCANEYDLIVVDTAPTAYALDFIEAPQRMIRAIESGAFRWLASRGKESPKFSLGLLRLGAGYLIKVLSVFIGAAFIDEFGAFVESFGGLWEGFKERAKEVQRILGSDDAAFLIISASDPVSLHEAKYIHQRLEEAALPIAGIVVNRVHQAFVPQPVLASDPREVEKRLVKKIGRELGDHHNGQELAGLAEHLLENARDFHVLAERDAKMLRWLDQAINGRTPIYGAPFFSSDIHSFAGLNKIRREIFEPLGARSAAERTLGRL